MASFSRLIRFDSGGKIYFSDLGAKRIEPPAPGSRVTAYLSLDDLVTGKNSVEVTLDKASTFLTCRVTHEVLTLIIWRLKQLLAPVPRDDLPIYCVGMNFRSHAAEAGVSKAMNQQ